MAARYALKLYVCGTSRRALEAVALVLAGCEAECAGAYDLEVVDVTADPERATAAGILVTPALVRADTRPPRRLVGDVGARGTLAKLLALPAQGEQVA